VSLTNLTIPASLTDLGDWTFSDCVGLADITIPDSINRVGWGTFNGCTHLNRLTIGGGVTNIEDSAFSHCSRLERVVIPDSVLGIGDSAFASCPGLTSVTMGCGVGRIGLGGFNQCAGLTDVVFRGNAPGVGSYVFNGADAATVYYLPGTTGWEETLGGRPVLLWNPAVQPGSMGVDGGGFGFTITGTTNIPVVVEASAGLAGGVWLPLQTNTLAGGLLPFRDPQWTNHPVRFYRFRFPQ
jgi:hypothetical protein